MAARRLVIVMVMLLAISTLAAAFIPTSKDNSGSSTTSTTMEPHPGKESAEFDPAPTAGDGLVNAHVRISNKAPKTILVRPGEELVLEVSGTFGDDVEIPGLGRVETMGTYSPAVFDIYANEAGTFGVRTVETDLLVAKIVVSAVPPNPLSPGKNEADPVPSRPKPYKPQPESSGATSAGAHGVQGSLTPGPQLQ